MYVKGRKKLLEDFYKNSIFITIVFSLKGSKEDIHRDFSSTILIRNKNKMKYYSININRHFKKNFSPDSGKMLENN